MQTEQEFLASYDMSAYPRPSVATDIVAFMIRSEDTSNYRQNAENKLSILLIRRGGHPYKDMWALPGGFLQPDERWRPVRCARSGKKPTFCPRR